jgi:hypothetical protein
MRVAIIGGSPSGGWLRATITSILHSGFGHVVELLDLIPSVEMYPLPLEIHDPFSFENWYGGVWEPARPGSAQSILGELCGHVFKGIRQLTSVSIRVHFTVYPFCVVNREIDISHSQPIRRVRYSAPIRRRSESVRPL